jgi:hypothetical protein
LPRLPHHKAFLENIFSLKNSPDKKRKIITIFGIKISIKNPKYFDVCMSSNEKEFFIENITDSKNYLEFGAGGSTFLVLLNSQARVVSVESSAAWLAHMRKHKVIKENKKRLHLNRIDVGKTGEWGYPLKHSESFPDYSGKIFAVIQEPDTVFVDGRFRVACTLKTILECKNKPKIIIHDFFNREQYHVLLEFLDVKAQADTMGVFSIKDGIDFDKVRQLYDEYKYNPA